MPQKRTEFRVSLVLPEGVTVAEAREYVHEAVACWRGGMLPEDTPTMFDADMDTLRVTRLRAPRKARC